ncbi:Bax inhibitor-1/YccA family protein [Sphingomonas sp. HITSZ_GF]|uniref:Bax inhibitor-1/YccA family protein n=1 Tax=Sphingomonas sp. HITSZ_GF TaxID=3037247 RepID=UPI00240E5560|nr:Bax inhibitor-1/YccA family protein [Sphingomonas sp. HITSZ_GF]MDG2535320.1 Bax inhibitor-1/YccA family protein [Sphingomonas sp. HITSZ_GF]
MANWSDPRTGAYVTAGAGADARDAGLRSYMLSVYNYMASGVLLTGFVALLFAKSGAIASLFTEVATARGVGIAPNLLGWIVMLAPLGIVLVMSFGQRSLSTPAMQVLYWVYATVMGLSLSTIFLQYTDSSIAQVFFGTAAGFAGLSLWGYTTKRDLSGFGTFLIMGLVGLIVASIVNLFVGSGPLSLAISVIGVLLFAGLTAYDTQKIKSMYFYVQGTDVVGKAVVMGALTLYLDFINMFLFLLRLFGSQRN